MLTTAVTSKSKASVLRYYFPEEISSFVIFSSVIWRTGFCKHLAGSFETNCFWNLSIGMQTIQIIYTCQHAVKDEMMCETFGYIQIFCVTAHCISISIHLVHSTIFCVEHTFHLFVIKRLNHTGTPITKVKKHFFGHFTFAVIPCITKTCKSFVHIIPWYPIFA